MFDTSIKVSLRLIQMQIGVPEDELSILSIEQDLKLQVTVSWKELVLKLCYALAGSSSGITRLYLTHV